MKNFPNQAKIIKVSTVIRHVLFAGVVLWAIGIPVELLKIILVTPAVSGVARWNLQGSFLLVMGFQLIVNFRLFRFFDRLKVGHLFDAVTVGHLASAGRWCIVLWLYEVLNAVIRREVLMDAPREIWNPAVLFVGLILIFFAWLLREAQGLQEEQALTV
jgi:hypothetical protein